MSREALEREEDRAKARRRRRVELSPRGAVDPWSRKAKARDNRAAGKQATRREAFNA